VRASASKAVSAGEGRGVFAVVGAGGIRGGSVLRVDFFWFFLVVFAVFAVARRRFPGRRFSDRRGRFFGGIAGRRYQRGVHEPRRCADHAGSRLALSRRDGTRRRALISSVLHQGGEG
jgi:hypothetical protein